MTADFIYFILGILIGSAVSIFLSMQAGNQLRREAAALREETGKLRMLHELTLYALTNPDANMQPKRDEAGDVVGLIVSAAGNASVRSSMKGELTLSRKSD